MPFKINISDKGKTFKLEVDNEALIGKAIGDKISGTEVDSRLSGYELEITGTSDKAGFPGMKDVEGQALKKVLLKKGFGMKSRPRREGKGKKRRLLKGLRLKKTVRGKLISRDTIQINIKVVKTGGKKLEEIFPKAEKEGEKAPAEQTEPKEEKKPETAPEEKKEEAKKEEKKEELKEESK
jgi:small subunit ribosomal protein S6e